MDLKLLYYYSDSCGACKAYEAVVDKLSKALRLSLQKQNIDVIRPQYKLDGIPTMILTNNGVEIWRSVGNISFQQVYKDIKDFI